MRYLVVCVETCTVMLGYSMLVGLLEFLQDIPTSKHIGTHRAGFPREEKVNQLQECCPEELQRPGQFQVLHDPDRADERRVYRGDDVALQAPGAAVLLHKVVGLALGKPCL